MTYHDDDTPHEWWVGETGTGKSKKLWDLYPYITVKTKTSGGATTSGKILSP